MDKMYIPKQSKSNSYKGNRTIQKTASKVKPIATQPHPGIIMARARANPNTLTFENIMQLQKSIGNKAVGQFIAGIGQSQKPVKDEELLQKKSKKENKTDLPAPLKTGLEALSNIDMSDVKVHYNSGKPEEVGALAFTQGNDIHIAPGQEKHLPHEGWHAVQQKQGRVRETSQMKTGIAVNDNEELEKEADLMGKKALTTQENNTGKKKVQGKKNDVIQKKEKSYKNDTIRITSNGFLNTFIGSDGWYIKNLNDKEYLAIQILKVIPIASTVESIQEGDWLTVAVDAALTLAGPVAKGAESAVLIAKNGKNAYKAATTAKDIFKISEKVKKSVKRIENGKLVYDSIEIGQNVYKNVVVSSEDTRMKKNDLVLKMIAHSYTKTQYVDSKTLEVKKKSKLTVIDFGEDTYATRDALKWCVNTYSEIVYTGKVKSDDLGISEFLYKEILNMQASK